MSGDPQVEDEEYISARISYVGFVDQLGLEGVVVLKSNEGKEFPMRAFSGEVARHISRFQEGDKGSIPTIYKLVDALSSMPYPLHVDGPMFARASVLSAVLYFTNSNGEIALRNYIFSTSMELARCYAIVMQVGIIIFEAALAR